MHYRQAAVRGESLSLISAIKPSIIIIKDNSGSRLSMVFIFDSSVCEREVGWGRVGTSFVQVSRSVGLDLQAV